MISVCAEYTISAPKYAIMITIIEHYCVIQVQALMQPGASPKSRREQEVTGYRDALELIHDAHADMPIQPGTIRQLHKIMYRYHPSPGGDYKRQSTCSTGRRSSTSSPTSPSSMRSRAAARAGSIRPRPRHRQPTVASSGTPALDGEVFRSYAPPLILNMCSKAETD